MYNNIYVYIYICITIYVIHIYIYIYHDLICIITCPDASEGRWSISVEGGDSSGMVVIEAEAA